MFMICLFLTKPDPDAYKRYAYKKKKHVYRVHIQLIREIVTQKQLTQ